MEDHQIIGIHVQDRGCAASVQKILSEYGDHIQTRLGLHEPPQKTGVLIINWVGDAIEGFEKAMNAIDGVEAKTIVFKH